MQYIFLLSFFLGIVTVHFLQCITQIVIYTIQYSFLNNKYITYRLYFTSKQLTNILSSFSGQFMMQDVFIMPLHKLYYIAYNTIVIYNLLKIPILQTYSFENAMLILLTKLLRSCQKRRIGKQTLMLLKLQSCIIILEEHRK